MVDARQLGGEQVERCKVGDGFGQELMKVAPKKPPPLINARKGRGKIVYIIKKDAWGEEGISGCRGF